MQALLKLTNFVSKTFALWAIVLLFSPFSSQHNLKFLHHSFLTF